MRIYTDLVDWYPLLDPLEHHEAEARAFEAVLRGAVDGPLTTLLELGAGAGHTAHFLAESIDCTLLDLSADMVALSRATNPTCAHAVADMRTARLGRAFDAVLVHDAISYMTTEADLRAALRTAFTHLRPGGAALFVPDCLAEHFAEGTELDEAEAGGRSLRCMAWMWDPDPADTTFVVDYALLLRDGGQVTAVHEQHVEGLFPEATWRRLLVEVGFDTVRAIPRPLDGPVPPGYAPISFLARRPARP